MMSRLVLLLALASPLLAAAREIPARTLELGGSTALSLSTLTTKTTGTLDVDTRTFGIDTWGSYYVAPNLGLGLALSLQDTSIAVGGAKSSSRTTRIGPALAWNFSLGERTSLFALGSLTYGRNASSGVPDSDGWGFGLGGGLSWFPVDAVAFSLSLTYQLMKLSSGATSSTDSGLVAGVGMSVFFLPASGP
jgi:hypothetical protein